MGKATSIVGVFVLFFGAAKVALADDTRPQNPSRHPLQVSTLVVPHELGQISQVHEVPHADPSAKLLILIQDAHVNYDAQKHLADILDWFVSQYGVTLILVEGGEGDVSLSYLRERGSNAVRKQVAEEYLQAGVLSGEEYLDIISDRPLILWGVDDPVLYDTHFNVFLEVERVRDAIGQNLVHLRQLVERLRAQQGTNEALKQFEATQAAFDEERLGFSEYLDDVLGESKRLGVAISDYPNLQRVVSAAQLEKEMDTEQVAQEQRRAVERLRHHTSEQELANLQEIAQRLQAGQVEPVAFYRHLESLMQNARLNSADFPHLSQYIRYIRLKADLQLKTLWSELAEVQHHIKARLASSSGEAELASIAERVARCERLIRLEWTPHDYQAYREQPEQIRISQWLPALREHAERLGVAFDWQTDGAALERQLASAVRFYDISEVRDAEIVRRAFAKMSAEGERVAVLIAGGFHTDNLMTLLVKQPVGAVVVTPLVGQETDEARYAEILKSKHAYRTQKRSGSGAFGQPEHAEYTATHTGGGYTR